MDKRSQQFEQEFTRLFDASQHDLFRYLLTLVPNHADARDLLQETAAALWNKFGEYERSRPFLTWARQFAYVEVIRYRRKQGQTSWRLLDLSDERLEALASEIDDHQAVLELRAK